MKQERLQKIIAMRGYCSRRKAEQLITNGSVKVEGITIKELGVKVNVDALITIDNFKLNIHYNHIYLMFNKPEKCITSAYDPQGRKTVFDYLTDIKERIYPIGRLDYDTTGLLLLTNDGQFANQIMHPSYAINKVYIVSAKGKFSEQDYQQLLKGVIIDDNFLAKANKVKVLKNLKTKQSYLLEITIQDGHNQQIRKMIQAISGRVVSLKRVAVDNLKLGNLQQGMYRFLTLDEVLQLQNNIKKENSTN